MKFRPGRFDREQVAPLVRPFCPLCAYHSATEIPLEDLRAQGKTLLLLDVDNTLVRWKQEDFSDEIVAWIERARALGFTMCILSNTRHPERLERIASRLNITAIRDRFKPSRRMYLLALERFQARPEQAVMIGDQLLTDILGANRAGIEAIWVNRINDHEFVGTRVGNRMIERAIIPVLYRALPVMSKLPDPVGAPEETSVRTQLFRFLVVGGLSFAVNVGIFMLLYDFIHVHGEKLGLVTGNVLLHHFPSLFGWAADAQKASTPIFKVLGAIGGICNSFFWNRRWTFGITDTETRARQFTRFAIINGTGALLDILITSILLNIVPGHARVWTLSAQVISAGIVAIWNFTGTRLWAFRKS